MKRIKYPIYKKGEDCIFKITSDSSYEVIADIFGYSEWMPISESFIDEGEVDATETEWAAEMAKLPTNKDVSNKA